MLARGPKLHALSSHLFSQLHHLTHGCIVIQQVEESLFKVFTNSGLQISRGAPHMAQWDLQQKEKHDKNRAKMTNYHDE